MALCVATMLFAGSASAQLGVVEQDVDGELSESGGNGSGTVVVDFQEEGGAEGTGEIDADAENQEVQVYLEGDGHTSEFTLPERSLDCTVNQQTVSEGIITEGCFATPFYPGAMIEDPGPAAQLAEQMARQAINNPEEAPTAISLLLLLVGLPGSQVPIDEIPWEQIPWEQIPNDQIPTEEFPRISEEIPWEQIPNDEVPL